MERPFWVAEQLEVALVEGLGRRLVWAATGRVIYRWHLASGVQRNREHPITFHIPPIGERQAVAPGMDVKLMFEMRDGFGERMWVTVVRAGRRRLVGVLGNLPVGIPRLMPGDKIKFRREHIIDIWRDDPTPELESELDPGPPSARLLCDRCNGPITDGERPGEHQIDPATNRPVPPGS